MTTCSSITSLEKLEAIPGSYKFSLRTRPITLPSPEFVMAVFGGDSTPDSRELVKRTYRNLLLPRPPAVEHNDMEFVPPALRDLLELMRFCNKRSHPQFHNGAGKMFVNELESFCSTWYPKISTTMLKGDWCTHNVGPVKGVVDVEFEGDGGRLWL